MALSRSTFQRAYAYWNEVVGSFAEAQVEQGHQKHQRPYAVHEEGKLSGMRRARERGSGDSLAAACCRWLWAHT